ncbi:MAG: hypothetical protein NTY96_12870 [Bacteroidetes bacterium]|nr:hypothetical protein [Bacteroidota bacterium]
MKKPLSSTKPFKGWIFVFFLLCITLVTLSVKAQDGIDINFNAFTGKFDKAPPKKVKEGTLINVIIYNINSELINVPEIKQKSIISNYLQVPTIFENFTKETNQEPIITKRDYDIVSNKEKANPPSPEYDPITDFKNTYIEFKKYFYTLNYLLNYKDNLFTEFDKPVLNLNISKEILLAKLSIIFKKAQKLDELPNLIADTTFKLISKLDSTYYLLQAQFENINKSETKDTIILKGELSSENQVKFNVQKAILIKASKPKLTSEFSDIKRKYSLLATDSARKITYAAILAIEDKILNISKNEFKYYLDPILINEDGNAFSISIKDKQGKLLRQTPEITIKTSMKFKLDFSAGFFFGSQQNDNFYTQQGKVKFSKEIKKDSIFKYDSSVSLVYQNTNKQPVNFSIGAMLNGYYDFGKPFAVGASFGISYPVAQLPMFAAGISLLFTSKHRIVLTFGASYANVKKLKPDNILYSDDGKMYLSDSSVQLSYDNVYKFGWFVGITYNFANLVK